MNLIDLLKSVSIWEWVFWIIVAVFSVKGFLAYPNILKDVEQEAANTGKTSL